MCYLDIRPIIAHHNTQPLHILINYPTVNMRTAKACLAI